MFDLSNIQLERLLPHIFRQDKDILALCHAFNKECEKLSEEITAILIVPAIDNIENEALLDELAYQFHVDYYDTTLNIETKKGLIKNYYRWHKTKGTKASIEELINLVFGDGDIEEWFEYAGDPYNFRVAVSSAELYNKNVDALERAINVNKRLTTKLEGIILQSKTDIILETSLTAYRFNTDLAGTLPYRNTILSQGSGSLEVGTKTSQYKYMLQMTSEVEITGVKPYRNTMFKEDAGGIEVRTEEQRQKFYVSQASENNTTGTEPRISILSADKGSIDLIDLTAESYRLKTKFCGTGTTKGGL